MSDGKYVQWGTHLNFRESRLWTRQIRVKNRGKNGRRYDYADGLFESLATIKMYTGISYRACEGIARGALRKSPDYTTICRRINALDAGIHGMEKFAHSDKHAGICLAVDASGLQPNERGEWMRDKWKLRRGFIKMHIIIEIKTRKIVAVSVTTEEKTDSSQLPVLLKDAAKQTDGKSGRVALYGDGGYDTNKIFNLCRSLNVEPRIKVRENSQLKAGRYARNDAVREQLGGDKNIKHVWFVSKEKMNENRDAWKKRAQYGQRWIVEVVFSAFKVGVWRFGHVQKMGEHYPGDPAKGTRLQHIL